MPLHTKLPTSRAFVEELDGVAVVLALLLAGILGIVLVLPLITSAVPAPSNENVVPDIVTTSPGRNVTPGPNTYSIVPSLTLAVYVFPSIVSAAAAVMGPFANVDVTPLITMTKPEAEAGILNVVPEMVRTPPGVRVCPGPKMNAVVPSLTFAVIPCLPSVRADCPGDRIEVTPLMTIVEP